MADSATALTVDEDLLGGLGQGMATTVVRCSAVAVFDHDMFDGVPLRIPDGPDLGDLCAVGMLERLPGRRARYRVAASVRASARWRLEQDAPRELRGFVNDLARWCGEHERPGDRLRALLLLGREQASAEFTGLFDDSARAGDLHVCASLLQVVDDAMRADPEARDLQAQVDVKRGELSMLELARELGLEPGFYLARTDLETEITRLLDDKNDRRPVQVRGNAGRGKSTLLRWLVVNRMALGRPTESTTKVCAYVDFDRLDPERAVRHPWLVALEIARQLDAVLPGRLTPLLDNFARFKPLIRRDHDTGNDVGEPNLDGSSEDGQRFVERFVAVLPDVLDSVTAWIVLDTFEEVMLIPDRAAVPLIKLLAKLQETDPSVRLLFSARGTEAEDTVLREGFRDAGTRVPVPNFREDESRIYLSSVRKIEDKGLVKTIVQRSQGLPWQLALDADYVQRHSKTTPEELAQLDTGVAWAIERIIARIDDKALRWIVRYGCTARRLTRDVVENVLLPLVERVITTRPDGIDDVVALDPFPLRGAPAVFEKGIEKLPTAGEIWMSLLRFRVIGTSWLMPLGDHDAVRFDDQLREPMRRLIDAQPVLGTIIHGDFIRYYEMRAQDRGDDLWLESTCEAIYHRSRRDQMLDESGWRDALGEARERNRPDWSVALAEDLLGEDFRKIGRRVNLPPEWKTAALIERAWGRVRLRGADGGDDRLWTDVNRALTEIHQLSKPAVPSDRWTLDAVEAAALIRTSPVTAAARLEGLLRTAERLADRREILVFIADALRAAGQVAKGRRWLQDAHDLALAEHVAPDVMTAITTRLADFAVAAGDLTDAQMWAADTNQLPRLALTAGLPGTALLAAPTMGADPERLDALLALCRPQEVLDLCSAALSDPDTAPRGRDRAGLVMRRGLAHAALLDLDDAVRDLRSAVRVLGELGDIAAQASARAHLFWVYLRGVGNVHEAGYVLDEHAPQATMRGTSAWLRHRLMRAEIQHTRGHEDESAAELGEAFTVLGSEPEPDPRMLVETAVAALCWADDLRGKAIETLLEQLPRIEPASARIAALAGLSRYLHPANPIDAAILDAAGARHRTPCADVDDEAWQRGRIAELQRAIGDTVTALRDVAASWDARSGSWVAWWEWLQAVERLGPNAVRTTRLPLFTADAWDETSIRLGEEGCRHLLLRAAAALTTIGLQAGRRGRAGARNGVILDWVDEKLINPPVRGGQDFTVVRHRTRWHVRLCELRLAGLAGRDTQRVRSQLDRALTDLGIELGTVTVPTDGKPRSDLDPLGSEIHLDIALATNGPLEVWSGSQEGPPIMRRDSRDPLVSALHGNAAMTVAAELRKSFRSGAAFRLDRLDIPAGRKVAVRIAEEPSIAGFPWELMMMGRVPLTQAEEIGVVYRRRTSKANENTRARILQEALHAAGYSVGAIDGIIGTRTEAAVRAVKQDAGLPVDNRRDEALWRRLRNLIRGRPASLKLDHETTLPVSRADELTPGQVDVVLIQGMMQESQGRPSVALTSESGALTRRIVVSPDDVDSLVARLSVRDPLPRTPLVILDIDPGTLFSSETMLQILLRNAFADRLLALGTAHSVLVTGVGRTGTAEAARKDLDNGLGEKGLGEDDTAAELAAHLQHGMLRHPNLAEAGLAETLPWTATALFTVLSPGLMPPLGVRRPATD